MGCLSTDFEWSIMNKTRLFIALQHALPQVWLTRLFSRITQSSKSPWLKRRLINWLIRRYKIDLSLMANPDLESYTTFNEFFIRQLHEAARPIAPEGIISPVDGTISQIGEIKLGRLIQAKGVDYALKDLLAGDAKLTEALLGGKFTTLYLAPKDYHRVHMPLTGKLLKTIYVPGRLFSVNAVTAQNVKNLFARNERLICEFATERGKMIMIFVGAMFVAGIHTSWAGDIKRGKEIVVTDYSSEDISLERAAEAGYFKFGSTIILLFPAHTIEWEAALSAGQTIVMGQKIA